MNNQDMDLKTERALRLESDSRFVSALINRMVDDVKKIYGQRAYLYIGNDGQLTVGRAKHRFSQLVETVKAVFKQSSSVNNIIHPEHIHRSTINSDGLEFIATSYAYDLAAPEISSMNGKSAITTDIDSVSKAGANTNYEPKLMVTFNRTNGQIHQALGIKSITQTESGRYTIVPESSFSNNYYPVKISLGKGHASNVSSPTHIADIHKENNRLLVKLNCNAQNLYPTEDNSMITVIAYD